MATATGSKAAQMRTAKAKNGLTTGEVARLFDVSYHHAYQATVVHASARNSAPPDRAEYVGVDEERLFLILATTDKRNAPSRGAARDELDRRDPDGGWLTRFEKFKAKALRVRSGRSPQA